MRTNHSKYRWSTSDGRRFGETFDSVAPALPEGWEVIKPWSIMLTSVRSSFKLRFVIKGSDDIADIGYVNREIWADGNIR